MHSEHEEPGRVGLTLWLDAPVPSRLQNEIAIGERKGARAGLPKGAVWRRLIYPHIYAADASTDGKAAWRNAWTRTDERACIDGPIILDLVVFRPRPLDHRRADGTLSPKGHATPYPSSKPDVSNYLKLVEDALKGLAFGDDATVVRATVEKVWCAPGQPAGALLRVFAVPAPVDNRLALPV